jgi:hypothetical protein
MQLEEAVLFSYVVSLEQSVSLGTAKPHSCFGTVANPIAMMTREHDAAGSLMARRAKPGGAGKCLRVNGGDRIARCVSAGAKGNARGSVGGTAE